MDDRIRASDADRDRVTARLHDHFAAGRLTREELDERVSAALGAKTFGDLRRVLADLPEPALVPPAAVRPQPAGRPWPARRYPPRLLPLVLLVLLAALLLPPGGWLVLAFFKVILVFWLVAALAVMLAAGRFRRRMRRGWPGYGRPGHPHWR